MLALINPTAKTVLQIFPGMCGSKHSRGSLQLGMQPDGVTEIVAVREGFLPHSPIVGPMLTPSGLPGPIQHYGTSLGVPIGWLVAAVNNGILTNTVIQGVTTQAHINAELDGSMLITTPQGTFEV